MFHGRSPFYARLSSIILSEKKNFENRKIETEFIQEAGIERGGFLPRVKTPEEQRNCRWGSFRLTDGEMLI